MTTPTRRVLLVTHATRADARELAAAVAGKLLGSGIGVCAPRADLHDTPLSRVEGVGAVDEHDDDLDCELVCVLGGDGTILRGAEISRGSGAPLLGVNLGHVGFLAEAEREDLDATVEHICARDYTVEERTTLEVRARADGREVFSSWALNEVTVEKAARERMLELTVEIDGRPLSTWGCDGVVVATPTGSTAYAFSAGGPVVWPDVEALLLVPISAHALFARSVLVGPTSHVAVQLLPDSDARAVLWCDGRRAAPLPPGAQVEVQRSAQPVRLARLSAGVFTDRLVQKFDLPVHGWRGGARRSRGAEPRP
ncbi:NAD kinase [Phycicoccus flavus]|uniref:NAD kinase n=1 Tax=Phycicoccus flavus TaxID=2502783 RepID=A0A8T6R1E6_9MICO|nr:NAD kinase [Phycicoccus flavus]NHA67787.1 NAD kinase [Phycicoccus flavus]